MTSTSTYLPSYNVYSDSMMRSDNNTVVEGTGGINLARLYLEQANFASDGSATSSALADAEDRRLMTADNGSIVGGYPTSLERFSDWYQDVHGYLAIVVCVFGSVSNIANVAVLTRPSMSTPTNILLTGIAAADLLTMVAYLPYAVYFYCLTAPDAAHRHSRSAIVYLLFHTNFIITCHTVAMWLTVSLAVFRYFAVCRSETPSSTRSSSSFVSSTRLRRRRPAISNSASYLSLKSQPAVAEDYSTGSRRGGRRRNGSLMFRFRIFNRRGAKMTVVGVLAMTVFCCLPIYGTYVPTPVNFDEVSDGGDGADAKVSSTAAASVFSSTTERVNGTPTEGSTDNAGLRSDDPDGAWWIGYSSLVTPTQLAFNFWVYGVVLKVNYELLLLMLLKVKFVIMPLLINLVSLSTCRARMSQMCFIICWRRECDRLHWFTLRHVTVSFELVNYRHQPRVCCLQRQSILAMRVTLNRVDVGQPVSRKQPNAA